MKNGFTRTFKQSVAMLSLIFILVLAACGNNATGGNASEGGSSSEAGGATLAAIKERDKLIAGVKYDTKLFGLQDPATGNVEGFDIDIAKALAKKFWVMKRRSSCGRSLPRRASRSCKAVRSTSSSPR